MKTLEQLYTDHQGKVSDKWSLYLDVYDRLFGPYRTHPVSLLEVGIQNGGSLEIWGKYFSEFKSIIGCDINPDCARLAYDNPRINVVVGDANDQEVVDHVLAISPNFDVIIDDGSHRSGDIVKTFCLYFSVLNDGGVFVAEDLHCSYWKDFEGGLHHPYSSVEFFKKLADIANHEHWGNDTSRESLLSGFCESYSCEIDAVILEHIHSVEFINSICVVRKKAPSHNVLGTRFIAGQVEVVVPGHKPLHQSVMQSQDQTQNYWSTQEVVAESLERLRTTTGDEQLSLDGLYQQRTDLAQQCAALYEQCASLFANLDKSRMHEKAQSKAYEAVILALQNELADQKRVSEEKDVLLLERAAALGLAQEQVNALHEHVDSVYRSRSWRLTRPLRSTTDSIRLLKNRLNPARRLLQKHGVRYLAVQSWQVLKTQGLAGLRQRAAISLVLNGAIAVPTGLEAASRYRKDDFLPSTTPAKELPAVFVDVVIPVYRGLAETRACIQSVLAAKCDIPFRIVLINDASPELEVTEYLRSLPQTDCLILLENEVNLGFIGTVNRGMSLSDSNDVLLLNSDTEVADGWLDNMARHAWSAPKVASVTPFSNNATIFSYPFIEGRRKLPAGETPATMARAFLQANRGRTVEVPTAVGFCMYIRRDSLKEIGLFDVAFGKGYGEENDFCLRASAQGWVHLFATDTFVFHAGEVSFQDTSSPGKVRAMEILRERYPHYEYSVAEYCSKNEVEPFRVAATSARFKLSGRPVILMIGHSLGGGTAKHWQELAAGLSRAARFLLITPISGVAGGLRMTAEVDEESTSLDFSLPRDERFLLQILRAFGVTRIHAHHLLGVPEELVRMIQSMGLPIDFTVHDYFTVCPQINLAIEGRYCGEPDSHGCNSCIQNRPVHGAKDILWWRQRYAWILEDADRVICPSLDVAQRIQRYHPAARVIVAPHEGALSAAAIKVPKVVVEEPLRIVLLGRLARHKGGELVAKCVDLARAQKLKLKFVLIGESEVKIESSAYFSQTGAYGDEELQGLIGEANPHLIWFASTWPETYSYTLSAALTAGRAVIAPDIGAFTERLAGRPLTWLAPWDITASGMLDLFAEAGLELARSEEGMSQPSQQAAAKTNFYETSYLFGPVRLAPELPEVTDLRREGFVSILVIAEIYGDTPSPCAYIRLLQPLQQLATVQNVLFRLVSIAEASRYIADVLYTHRVAAKGATEAASLILHACKYGMRLVYDLDDDLITIAQSDHPERDLYAKFQPSIEAFLRNADEITVSTEALQQLVARYERNALLVPNALDPDLWQLKAPRPAKRENLPVGIVYMGTQTHAADFDFVTPVLQKIKAQYAEKVSIYIVGVTPDRRGFDGCTFIDVPANAGASYPAFAAWLSEQEQFDIGIAPLLDSLFNQCKSGIKYLDYATLGLAVVASDVNAYRSVISHEVTGLLVPNLEDEWFDALRKLIDDPRLRYQLGNAARNDLIRQHILPTLNLPLQASVGVTIESSF